MPWLLLFIALVIYERNLEIVMPLLNTFLLMVAPIVLGVLLFLILEK